MTSGGVSLGSTPANGAAASRDKYVRMVATGGP